jgi:hypothetical protein
MAITTPTNTGLASTNPAANQGTVKAGDTAFGIAQSLKQTPEQFLTNNPTYAAKGASNDYKGLTGAISVGQKYNTGTPQSTTTLSSNKNADIANINNKQNTLNQSGITTKIGSDGNPISTYANGSAVPPSATTLTSASNISTANANGTTTTGGYNGNIYVRPGDPIPKDANGNPVTLTATSPQDDANTKQIQDLKAQFDAQGVQQLQNIENSYNNLIQQQTQANAGQQGQINNALLMGGATGQGSSAQYAPVSSAGMLASQISYGLQQLSTLNAQKQQAITQAEQAIQNGDFKYAAELQDQADKITQTQQDAMNKMNDTINANNQKLADQKLQNTKDNTIADLYSQGTTDPTKILQALQKAGNTSITMSDINSTLKTIADNAPSKDYLQHQNDTRAKGLVPLNYSDWKDAQDKKASALKASDAYNSAYASAAGKAAGENANGGSGTSNKVQQSLEQQGRQIIAKEFSARTGSLGVENAKVNQANHLNSLFSQYYDPKTGNYNIPKSQYTELAIGLATLVSPTGTPSEGTINNIMQATAKGDLNNALSYASGIPFNGSTQEVYKNLIDSVDRQAQTAERNRQAALDNMKDLLPTDLEQSRKDALIKATNMVSYEGQDRISKNNVTNYIKSNPNAQLNGKPIAEAVATMADIPGTTPKDIEDYLKARGLLQ